LAQFHAVTEAKPIFFKNKSTTRWLRISQALLLMVIVVSGGWVWSLHQQLAQYAGMMPEPTPEVVSFPTSGNRPSLGARARARAPQQKQQPEVNYWLAVIIFTAIIALTVLILLLRGRRKRLIRSINEIIIRDSALRSGT
jgi:heme A synthase